MRPTTTAGGRAVRDGAGAESPFPAVDASIVPVVTGEQMREVDRLMIEEFGISLLQMMENANRGVDVAVVLAGPDPRPGTAAAVQLGSLQAMGVPISTTPRPAALVIDALVGYGLVGPLSGAARELAAWADGTDAPVLSLDAPTGLDVTTGAGVPGVVTATATVTLALPKPGLLGTPRTGELYLADISVPAAVYRRLGIEVPVLFARTQVIRLLETRSPHPVGRRTGPA